MTISLADDDVVAFSVIAYADTVVAAAVAAFVGGDVVVVVADGVVVDAVVDAVVVVFVDDVALLPLAEISSGKNFPNVSFSFPSQ